MPPPYRNPHWPVFSAIPYVSARGVGHIPANWVSTHGLAGVPAAPIPLPTHQLDRTAVRAICRNPAIPVLFGYVCAMAWGSQGARRGGTRHVAAAWAAQAALLLKLHALRAGGLTKCQAYNLFLGKEAVPGLGPAYFTKLLYFFSPAPYCYIMDQWTAKSVELLTGNRIVRFANDYVSNQNKCGNYQAYCDEVDSIAALLGVAGDQAEEMMMSKGGHHPWPWRAHVRTHWPAQRLGSRYNRSAMHGIYPLMPLACF